MKYLRYCPFEKIFGINVLSKQLISGKNYQGNVSEPCKILGQSSLKKVLGQKNKSYIRIGSRKGAKARFCVPRVVRVASSEMIECIKRDFLDVDLKEINVTGSENICIYTK